jgi:hypothetical protein
MAGGGMSYHRAVSAGLADVAPLVAAAEMAAVEPGDLVVGGVLSIDDAVALQEARGCLAVHVLTAPILPTASGPSTVFAIRPQGNSVLNSWVGRAALAGGAPMMTTTGRHLRDQLNLPRTRPLGFVKMLQTVPTLLTTSPVVTPPPGDWPDNICQTGIWFDDRLAELITTLTTPDQASQWLAGAAAARSHLLQERGLEVALERLSTLMTRGAPLARSTSATRET